LTLFFLSFFSLSKITFLPKNDFLLQSIFIQTFLCKMSSSSSSKLTTINTSINEFQSPTNSFRDNELKWNGWGYIHSHFELSPENGHFYMRSKKYFLRNLKYRKHPNRSLGHLFFRGSHWVSF